MGWAWFLLCTWFILFLVFSNMSQPALSQMVFELPFLWCSFTKSCWTLMYRKCYRYYSFLKLCIKYICIFGFIKVFDSKQKLNTALKSAMECADVAAFTFTICQIRWCFLWEFNSPETTVINLFAVLWAFLVGLDNLSGCFVEVSSEIWRKIKCNMLQLAAHLCQHLGKKTRPF